MFTKARYTGWVIAASVLFLQTLQATLVPRLSFDQLTDTSELIVSGTITSSRAGWDSAHKYIWTHYSLSVASAMKGNPGAVVEFAEPGGALDGKVTMIAGSVQYAVGDNVVVFLSRMPNGYLRTNGWAQGKYGLDATGKLHGNVSVGADIVEAKTTTAESSPRTLEGMSVTELGQRVAARLHATQGRAR